MVNIEDGWHVNANKPTLDYLIGTSFSLQDASGFSVVNTQYPEAEMLRFGFAQEPLAVYEGQVYSSGQQDSENGMHGIGREKGQADIEQAKNR